MKADHTALLLSLVLLGCIGCQRNSTASRVDLTPLPALSPVHSVESSTATSTPGSIADTSLPLATREHRPYWDYTMYQDDAIGISFLRPNGWEAAGIANADLAIVARNLAPFRTNLEDCLLYTSRKELRGIL